MVEVAVGGRGAAAAVEVVAAFGAGDKEVAAGAKVGGNEGLLGPIEGAVGSAFLAQEPDHCRVIGELHGAVDDSVVVGGFRKPAR